MRCTITCAYGRNHFVKVAWANDLELLRSVAASNLRDDWLRRWWCEKYNRPSKDPLLKEYTVEELMIEFLEDLIDKDPSQEFPTEKFKAGTAIITTGDAIADAWAKDIAEGKVPDFLASFDAEDRAKIEKLMKKSEKQKDEEKPPEDFHDVYVNKE